MEGILNNQTALARSSPKPIIPSRNYDAGRKKADVPTVQQATAKRRFSQLTPVYASTPVHNVVATKRHVRKGVEFVKTTKHPKDRQAHHTKSLEFVEAHLDAIDLDLTNGIIENYALLPSGPLLINDDMAESQASMMQQYFERQSDELPHKRSSDKTTRHINIRSKHVGRFFVLVLIASVMGLWGYIISDNFALTEQANAVATQTNVVNTSGLPVDSATYNPKTLTISKLNIHSPIDSIDLTSTGAMGVPSNIWNAGWYVGSSKPGQPGAVFIDGHSSSSRGALFGNLDALAIGDQIEIERADGIKVKYSIGKVSVVNRNDVDMVAMFLPYDPHKNGLNIMSCVGEWIPAESTLENRVLVYAVEL